MQSNKHEFSRPSSPPVPYINIDNDNIHIQTRYDGSSNKIIHVTNYNRGGIPLDNFPEDSCDSFINEDSASLPGRPSGETMENYSFMAVLTKCNENLGKVKSESCDNIPYHRIQQQSHSNPQSPKRELSDLIKSVEASQNNYQEPLPSKEVIVGRLTAPIPRLEILEEPETTYRARYESEGCKGPIHGSSETGFPSVKIVGYVGEVIINVYVVTSDFETHLHTATGPGSSKVTCQEVKRDDGTPAIQMVMRPTDENDDMVAVFDQLSIRRVRNWEADRELRKRGIEPSSWKSKKKEAKLAFEAIIAPSEGYHDGYSLITYSRPFLCTAPSGNPEIWWMSRDKSTPEGGDEIGFIGKKFASGFKVRFFSKEDDGNTWEANAEVDKSKSNLNACVVKIPPYKDIALTENVIVHVEIRVGSEKEPRCSDPCTFTYTAKKVERCENCVQIKSYLQKICNGENTDEPSFNLVNIKPEIDSPKRINIKTPVFQPIAKVIKPPVVNISKPVVNNVLPNNSTVSLSQGLRDLLKNNNEIKGASMISTPAVTLMPYNQCLPVVTPVQAKMNDPPFCIGGSGFVTSVPRFLQNQVSMSPQVYVNSVNTLQGGIPRPTVCVNNMQFQTQPIIQVPRSNIQYRNNNGGLIDSVNQISSTFQNITSMDSNIVVEDKVKQEQQVFSNNFPQQQQHHNSFITSTVSPLVGITPLVVSAVQSGSMTTPVSNMTVQAALHSQPLHLNVNNNSIPPSPVLNSPVIRQQNISPSILQGLSTTTETNTNVGTPNIQNQLVILTNVFNNLKKQLEQQQQQSVTTATNLQVLTHPDIVSKPTDNMQQAFVNTQTLRPLDQPMVAQQLITSSIAAVSSRPPSTTVQQQHFFQNINQQNSIQQMETSNILVSQQINLQEQQQQQQQQQQQIQQQHQQLQQHHQQQQQQPFQLLQQQNVATDFANANSVVVGNMVNVTPVTPCNLASSQSVSIQQTVMQQPPLQQTVMQLGDLPQQASVLPLDIYQQNSVPPVSVFQTQSQQQLVSPSFDQLPVSRHLANVSFDAGSVDGSLNDQWNPPSINDAIASNKVGFKENCDIVHKSRPESPMEINVDTENNFLKTLQLLNGVAPNPNEQLGMVPNGILLPDGNVQPNLQQQIQHLENGLTNQQITGST